MSSRKSFKSKRTFKVVSYKGGKVNRRSRVTVPVQYATRSGPKDTCVVLSSEPNPVSDDACCVFDSNESMVTGECCTQKTGKLRLKNKIKAYRDKKVKLGKAWQDIRQQLFTRFVEFQALPPQQCCNIPSCSEKACGRCLDCGPVHFICDEHIRLVHAGGKSLHNPEIWKVSFNIHYMTVITVTDMHTVQVLNLHLCRNGGALLKTDHNLCNMAICCSNIQYCNIID